MITSIINVVPFSAIRGVLTRPIWMSRDSVSCPTPTVNTGTPCDLSASSDSPERAFGGIRAVGDHDQAGQRQPGQFLTRAVEGDAKPCLRAGERQLVFGIRRARRRSRSGTSAP